MKKIIIGVLIFILLAGGGAAAYLFYGSVDLQVMVEPTDALIKIDEQAGVAGKFEGKLKPGWHTINSSKKGYASSLTKVKLWGGRDKEVAVKLAELPKASSLLENLTSVELSEDWNNILISGDGGTNFYKYNPGTGEKTAISKLNFGKVKRVKWSPNRYLAFIWREDETAGLVDLKRYDLVNQEFKLWGKAGKGFLDLAWSPDGKEVAYVYQPGDGEFSIIRADAGNQTLERVYDLRGTQITNPYMEWAPDGKKLMVADKDVYTYTFYTHEWKNLTNNGAVALARLSLDGRYVFYTTKDGLFRIDLDGTGNQRLDDQVESLTWKKGGKFLVGYRGGEFTQISIEGERIAFAYNGERVSVPEKIVLPKSGTVAYSLIKGGLTALFLQPSIVKE